MKAAALALLLVALVPSAVSAEARPVKQALIVLRVLAYDRALDERAGSRVGIAVIHGAGAESLACASRMRGAFDRLASRVTVRGKPIRVDTIAASAMSESLFARRRISVAYVCRGADRDIAQVRRVARATRALTFSDQVGYLERGLSIALVPDTTRIRLSINLEAARAEGARLDSQLLRLSEVVKR